MKAGLYEFYKINGKENLYKVIRSNFRLESPSGPFPKSICTCVGQVESGHERSSHLIAADRFASVIGLGKTASTYLHSLTPGRRTR